MKCLRGACRPSSRLCYQREEGDAHGQADGNKAKPSHDASVEGTRKSRHVGGPTQNPVSKHELDSWWYATSFGAQYGNLPTRKAFPASMLNSHKRPRRSDQALALWYLFSIAVWNGTKISSPLYFIDSHVRPIRSGYHVLKTPCPLFRAQCAERLLERQYCHHRDSP